MIRDWVKLRLAQWGRWARGGLPSLPRASPLWNIPGGRAGGFNTSMPPDIAEVDHLVCAAPLEQKRVLIVIYAQDGSMRDKAVRLEMDRHRFRRMRERAESYIAANL